MDPIDALEDYLLRQNVSSPGTPQMLSAFLRAPSWSSTARSTIFRSLLNMTPLQYAIDFSPEDVKDLLSTEYGPITQKELELQGPLLVYVVGAGNAGLIKPLVEAGVDVNQKYCSGETALHVICRRCYYVCLQEILACAGDKLDWKIRTPNGQNALELFEEGVAEGRACKLSEVQVAKFRGVLESRVGHEERVRDFDESWMMPGAFPCSR